MSFDFQALIPPSSFAWKMRMRGGSPEQFFGPADATGEVQRERLRWLEETPDRCLAETGRGRVLLRQGAEKASDWSGAPSFESDQILLELGKYWESDFLLLDGETFTLEAGCVCLPSSWSLENSIGKSLAEIHGRVPRLDQDIGESIRRFLTHLPDGRIFFRENWSLTRSGELNYHPALKRPRLTKDTSPEELFFRIEHQAFTGLPGGVLMGIRIDSIPVHTLTGHPAFLQNLHRQLATMPKEVSDYKGLSDGIPRVLEILEALSPS